MNLLHSMFNQYYHVHLKNKEKLNDSFFKERHIYTLKSEYNKQTYIIECFFKDDFLCSITFYLKNHRLSKDKYKLKTGYNDFTRIIRTCLEVYLNLLRNCPFLSLLVEGVYSTDERHLYSSKRFKIYLNVLKNLFSPENFDIISHKNYILLFNKTNTNLDSILSELKHYIDKTS